jgi:hypothetical protein
MCNSNCCKSSIKFTKNPIINNWNVNDGEVTLFEEVICISGCRQLIIDAVITAEIMGIPASTTAYNTYRLYVGCSQVCQSGYEAEQDTHGPNLSSASLIWGGSASCQKSVSVRVTAQLTHNSESLITSNINNGGLTNFIGSKGAFLRVISQ